MGVTRRLLALLTASACVRGGVAFAPRAPLRAPLSLSPRVRAPSSAHPPLLRRRSPRALAQATTTTTDEPEDTREASVEGARPAASHTRKHTLIQEIERSR